MRKFLLGLVILAVCFAATPTNFTATATWTQDIKTGTQMQKVFNVSMSYAGLNSLMAVTYNFQSGSQITEIFDYNNHQILQICTTCSTSYTSDHGFRLYLATGSGAPTFETINGVKVNTYTVPQPDGFMGRISFSNSSELIVKAVLTSASVTHTFVFASVTPGVQNAAFIPKKTCSPLVCTRKLDLVILLDESGSIDDDQWSQVVAFANQVISSFTIAEDKVKIGVITFSSAATAQIPLSANETAIRQSLSKVNRTYLETNLAAGINQSQILLDSGRPNPKAIIIITDGNPYLGPGINAIDPAKAAAAAARNKGTTIYAIGVGSQINYDILFAVATANSSDTSYVAKVGDFGSLSSIQNTLVQSICLQGQDTTTVCQTPCAASGFCATCDGTAHCICTKNCSSFDNLALCQAQTCQTNGECGSKTIPPPDCCTLDEGDCNNHGTPNTRICAVNSTVPCSCGTNYCGHATQDYRCLCGTCDTNWDRSGGAGSPCDKCVYPGCITTRSGNSVNTTSCNSCICSNCANGGTYDPTTCKCISCPAPFAVDTNFDCKKCDRPTGYCNNGGTLSQTDCTTCSCKYPWTGSATRCTTCDIKCQNGGTAVTTGGKCECQCAGGWTGQNCTTCTPQCNGRGVVADSTTCTGCNCQGDPWTGTNCACARTNSYCLNGGTINPSTCTCQNCNPGYGGSDCGTCVATNSSLCSGHGAPNLGDCRTCTCDPGWSGTSPNCGNCDRNSGNFCSGNGNVVSCSTCNCNTGWTGPSCNTCSQTPSSLCRNRGSVNADCTTCTCSDPSFVNGNQCQSCVYNSNSYCYGNGTLSQTDCKTCSCNPGYGGARCQTCTNTRSSFCYDRGNLATGSCTTCTCDDPTVWKGARCDTCAYPSNYCGNGTLDTTDCVTCKCNPGYSGPRCQTCTNTRTNFCGDRGNIATGSCTTCTCDDTTQWTGANCTTCARTGTNSAYCNGRGTVQLDCRTCTCSPSTTWSGDRCETCILPNSTCSNRGYVDRTRCSCTCNAPFTGSTCSQCDRPAGYCANSGTLNTSDCTTCRCTGNWTGTTCNQCSLTAAYCGAQGTLNTNDCKCDCKNGWTGPKCDICPTATCTHGSTYNASICGCNCPTATTFWSGVNCSTCGATDADCGLGYLNADTCTCTCQGYVNKTRGKVCDKCYKVDKDCNSDLNRGKVNTATCSCECLGNWKGESCFACNLPCNPGFRLDKDQCQCIKNDCDLSTLTCDPLMEIADPTLCACICDVSKLTCKSYEVADNTSCACVNKTCDITKLGCTARQTPNNVTCTCVDIPCNLSVAVCGSQKVFNKTTCACDTPPAIKPCNLTAENCDGKIDNVTCTCLTETTPTNVESPGSKKNNTPYIIAGVVAGVLLLLAIAGIIAFLLLKKKPIPEATPFEMQNVGDAAKITGSPIYKDVYSSESPVYKD